MGKLQKTVQDMQANTGSTISSMTQQSQGISDNVQDLQARFAKLSQQLNDVQSTLQSIDAKVSKVSNNGAPAGAAPGATIPGGTAPSGSPSATSSNSPAGPAGMAPISADTLYQNALRDYTSGNYALSRQEFSDYIKNFPKNDLASNAQFYLGEIAYTQGDYKAAIAAYETVLQNYPQSFKLGASLLKKGMAELELGRRTSATRDLRGVIRRFPGSDEAHRAEAKLRELERPSSRRRR
jgi:tol-pal system protein YbgF